MIPFILHFFKYFFTGPNGVNSIRPELDANNLTLIWDKPNGRIEAYDIKWSAIDRISTNSDLDGDDTTGESLNSDEYFDARPELFIGEKTVERDIWNDIVRIPISPLMSGVAYALNIGTTSYGIRGQDYNVTIRTCKPSS